MTLAPRRLVSVLTGAIIAGALSFGAAQAFASVSAPASAGTCDIFACFQACQERYGEGAQPYCDKWGDCYCIR